MVDIGKREDRLLDFIGEMNGRITSALWQIDLYREGALTASEIKILGEMEAILKKKDEDKA